MEAWGWVGALLGAAGIGAGVYGLERRTQGGTQPTLPPVVLAPAGAAPAPPGRLPAIWRGSIIARPHGVVWLLLAGPYPAPATTPVWVARYRDGQWDITYIQMGWGPAARPGPAAMRRPGAPVAARPPAAAAGGPSPINEARRRSHALASVCAGRLSRRGRGPTAHLAGPRAAPSLLCGPRSGRGARRPV